MIGGRNRYATRWMELFQGLRSNCTLASRLPFLSYHPIRRRSRSYVDPPGTPHWLLWSQSLPEMTYREIERTRSKSSEPESHHSMFVFIAARAATTATPERAWVCPPSNAIGRQTRSTQPPGCICYTGAMQIEFTGTIWFWKGPAPWYFVTVPEEQCRDLQAIAGLVTYGWGMIPAQVRIGGTAWTTSLFPKDGRYLVPIKASVRHAEQLAQGDTVTVYLDLG